MGKAPELCTRGLNAGSAKPQNVRTLRIGVVTLPRQGRQLVCHPALARRLGFAVDAVERQARHRSEAVAIARPHMRHS